MFDNPLFKNTLKMSLSNVLMYFVPIVVTPILSRMYSQEAFGEWGVFSSTIAILSVGMFWGYEHAIVKASSESDAQHVGIICLINSLITILFTVLAFEVGSTTNVSFFQSFPEKYLLIIYLFIYALYLILYNFCNRQEKYNVLAISHVVLGGSQAIFRISFGLIVLVTVNGLILGTTLAQALNVLFILVCLKGLLNNMRWTSFSIEKVKELYLQNRRFPLYDAPASIMSFAAFQSPTIILSQFFTKAEIGCFSIIIQLLLMPMSFIGTAMGKVYYQQLCRTQGDYDAIREVSKKVVNTVCLISIMPLLFLSVGGDQLLVIFLGEKWTASSEIALCLALWSFPTILSQPLIPLYRKLDRQKNLLLFNALYFIGGVGSITYGCLSGRPLSLILLIFSLVTALCKFCMFTNLLKLCGLGYKQLNKYIVFLWLISIMLLAIRIKDIVTVSI
ncbi:MAG: oligosaccharide flippase family protein [Bacteroidales bacterium]|nr:oligosaccharide flippase family protein [Bacteroidales bacterium]